MPNSPPATNSVAGKSTMSHVESGSSVGGASTLVQQPRGTSTPFSPSFATIVNIILGVRRTKARAAKSNYVDSNSGEEPLTHSALKEAATSKKLPVRIVETFICSGGVDAAKLVRGTRTVLLNKVEAMGANALIDEQWKCIITGPKNGAGNYKVHVTYTATATRAVDAKDPHSPVAIEQARSVPGLMTIVAKD